MINQIAIELGNYARKQLKADVGGGDKDLSYRLLTLAHSSNPQNDYPDYKEDKSKRFYLAPSLSLALDDNTSLLLQADYRKVNATNNSTEYLAANQQRSYVLTSEPAFDKFEQEQWNVSAQLEHNINDNWGL